VLSLEIVVSGVVQGVGFRPFVKRIALKAGVAGYVVNMGGGEVLIRVEGPRRRVVEFLRLFREERPRPAEVMHMRVSRRRPEGFKAFEILKSSSERVALSMVPPDIGICEDCIREIDSDTRWRDYPFNSCAWCGPRFSMMYRVPYDRENTSMVDFPLCRDCLREYTDVSNERRFHAQGISCPACGPRMWLVDRDGELVDDRDPIRTAAKLVAEGRIVAVKGIGGFHIACRADDDDVVSELRRRKRRPQKPFAVMARDLEVARRLAVVDDDAARLLTSPQRPIVLLRKRDGAPLSKHVSPGLDTVGIMLPYSGIHHILLKSFPEGFMIMTSGNAHNKPMESSNEGALRRLRDIADYFLLHNRRIVNRVDDSVVRFTAGRPVFLRRGRGYAPRWIVMPAPLERPVVAFGAELQNAGAVGVGNKVIPTQFIGDTDELENMLDLDRYLRWFVEVYRIDISRAVIVADKHPRYSSRMLAESWAKRHGASIVYLQHHAAHAYAVMCEYGAKRGVVVAMDGAGYGEDGAVWGGEVIAVDHGEWRRVGRLEYHVMPGGDAATYHPVRMLLSILSRGIGFERAVSELLELGVPQEQLRDEVLAAVRYSLRAGRPLTSSTGRVLDAASAMLGICYYRSYEGEPAMKLEAFSRGGRVIEDLCRPSIRWEGVAWLETSTLFRRALDALHSESPRDVAATIQYYVGRGLGEIARREAERMGVSHIYLAGGAAVNDYIAMGVRDAAAESGIAIRLPRELPPGDGSISTGQVYYIALSRDYGTPPT